MLKHQLTCKERVAGELADRLNDIKTANLFYSSLQKIKQYRKTFLRLLKA